MFDKAITFKAGGRFHELEPTDYALPAVNSWQAKCGAVFPCPPRENVRHVEWGNVAQFVDCVACGGRKKPSWWGRLRTWLT